MEKLQIDFIMDKAEDIAKWFDDWSVERFGKDCLNPERYFKTTDDNRYLYGVAEGAANEEKAIREQVLELLCKINKINKELNGIGLNYHLTYQERKAKKIERKRLYNEFINITQQKTKKTESQQKTKKKYFDKAIQAGLMEKTGSGYNWLYGNNRGKIRLAYFIYRIYAPEERIPYKELQTLFGISRLDSAVQQLSTAKKEQSWKEEIDKVVQSV